MRRLVRAIARRRSVLVAEPRGRFGNAASVRAGRRTTDRKGRLAPILWGTVACLLNGFPFGGP
ncbi:hypothetical protein EOT10_22295 [Streptomyces antnestii]|uniref:Uncharacterized protein n=1 Tax=Streptomyces antnestii TaxID=2494256 RepID=A0A437PK50_9ACTN|nr:hypothetical protein EOT10_22295 [Streptomyces sp. San01]